MKNKITKLVAITIAVASLTLALFLPLAASADGSSFSFSYTEDNGSCTGFFNGKSGITYVDAIGGEDLHLSLINSTASTVEFSITRTGGHAYWEDLTAGSTYTTTVSNFTDNLGILTNYAPSGCNNNNNNPPAVSITADLKSGVPDPVFSGGTASSSSESSNSTGTKKNSSSTSAAPSGNIVSNKPNSATDDLHQKGAALVQALLAKHSGQHTAAQITKVCEARKGALTVKIAAINKRAVSVQAVIDDIFAKAQAYQVNKNLTVANWGSLVTSATSAQSAASGAIANLKAVTPNLNCNSGTVATDIATYKVATQTTHDNLQTYKTAVKVILRALKSAKTTTSEGSN